MNRGGESANEHLEERVFPPRLASPSVPKVDNPSVAASSLHWGGNGSSNAALPNISISSALPLTSTLRLQRSWKIRRKSGSVT
eukprot:CAMPEP_0178382978 /NCGR_PEP_ID=MMETSP0689_2-20121128/6768_1 /TAXON_ID=160604 /ORGANISM="Amphidinium massartii, Strain CS-259" /LENGTH=82 /DNA_ID=CAMNT_0020003191 /DNA_START=396 /DNA_END=642 /DNA_ORIENTATION=-